jgi:hypothetical protein
MPSNLNNSIRIVIAVVYALTLALFILLWEARLIPIPLGLPVWLGFIVFLPLISFLESLGTNSLIQFLGCQKVNFMAQLMNSFVAPTLIAGLWTLLYFLPGLRYPVEGLFLNQSPELKKGLSSGFYVFWIALYAQTYSNGLAQKC